MYKASLHSRIIFALVVIVTVTSTLFATGVLLIKQQLEEVVFGEMVHDQLQFLNIQLEENTYSEQSLFKDWMFYFDDNISQLPQKIISLPEGSHHSVKVVDQYFQVEVGHHNNQPIYLTYNITNWENQEHELLEMLAYGVGIVLIVAIFMGQQASRAILTPVKSLTKRLTDMHPNQRNIRIAKDYQGNEIGQIANAFDRYQERLDQFVDREHSFTAAASHELRTPLSVMMGAIDVLDAQQHSHMSCRAIARIKRACAEMLAFIEATLFLSREDSKTISQNPPTDLKTIILSLIEDQKSSLIEKHIELNTRLSSTLTLQQPDSIVQIMIGNILRNAIEHTDHGKIDIFLNQNSFIILDTGSGIPTQDLPHIFDRSYTTKEGGTGLGLNLVKRICDRFNWSINVQSKINEGTKVTIFF